MRIGNLTLENPLILAPLAGISSYPFRLLARKYGAALCYTEMISADALVRDNETTIRMLDMPPDEHPVGVQVFGSNPENIALAVKRISELKPDLIDINIGCPVPKVIKKNGGAALLKNPALAGEIMAAAAENTSLPVTIKMRSGWKDDEDVYIELGKMAEKYRLAAVTLHPRARSENYEKKSDWSKIALLKKELTIPVIGNGDVVTPQDAFDMLKQTGCDAVMIGRAAMKNPQVFQRMKAFLHDGEFIDELSPGEKMALALTHTELMITRYGERKAVLLMRKHLAWYSKGILGACRWRENLRFINTLDDVRKLINENPLGNAYTIDG